MTRVKTGPQRRRRHKKVLQRTKGFRMTKNRLFKVAHEAFLHAFDYAYIGRKLRKRDFRKLWIQRINIALRQVNPDYKYSTFINKLQAQHIELDRKSLADLAVNDFKTFSHIANQVYK